MSKRVSAAPREISVFVNPRELREWAGAMEKRMAKAQVGERVWSESFTGGEFEVRLVADQDWFHKRAEGIPDWDAMEAGTEALERFKAVDPIFEGREFPETYSGIAWKAAYRMWRATEKHGAEFLARDPYAETPEVDLKDLELTGFMFGWARNAVRKMLGMAPGQNPAIVTVGSESPAVPAMGSANADLRRVLGGD